MMQWLEENWIRNPIAQNFYTIKPFGVYDSSLNKSKIIIAYQDTSSRSELPMALVVLKYVVSKTSNLPIQKRHNKLILKELAIKLLC